MKRTIGWFLAGVLAAFLFDPASGRGRREKLGQWSEPTRQRVAGLKDRATARDGGTGQDSDDSQGSTEGADTAPPRLLQSMSKVARRLQGQLDDGAAQLNGAAQSGPPITLPETTPDAPDGDPAKRAVTEESEAPAPIADPIPEGDPDTRHPGQTINDPTLVARVESELYRDQDIPKGKLNIDSVHGVVTIRGSVGDEALAASILERAHAVEGVRAVVDMLHRG